MALSTLLVHPHHQAPTSLTVDASDISLGAVLEQRLDGSWKPIAFFSKKLKPAEKRYSTFDRELLGIYLAIKHFRHLLEGRNFHVYTDHKPLTFAIDRKSDIYTPRQTRHLSYVSEFTTDIRHISGKTNVVADALSRIEINQVIKGSILPETILEIATAQANDPEILALRTAITSLQLKDFELPNSNLSICCDISTGKVRPYVPVGLRQRIFELINNLSHPGIAASTKLVSERFVWHSMGRDIKLWTRQCTPCQKSKIQRHTSAPFPSITHLKG